MKVKIFKKLFFSAMCAVVVLTSLSSMTASAAYNKDLYDFLVGGSYNELKNQDYNHNDYECHYVIPKETLNQWARYIVETQGLNKDNKFIVGDLDQNWAPAIIMEKVDHEKILNYYNRDTKSPEQNISGNTYISKQANRIINDGDILGVFEDEIDLIQSIFGDKYDRAINEVAPYMYWIIPGYKNKTCNTLNIRTPDHFFDEVFFEFKFGK